LKGKINVLYSDCKNNKIRDLCSSTNAFKKCYQTRTNYLKDERDDLLVDPHKILNRLKNCFCQLFNVHGAGGFRQSEQHTAEPFVLQPSASEIEATI
jgi:hypothetical protein